MRERECPRGGGLTKKREKRRRSRSSSREAGEEPRFVKRREPSLLFRGTTPRFSLLKEIDFFFPLFFSPCPLFLRFLSLSLFLSLCLSLSGRIDQYRWGSITQGRRKEGRKRKIFTPRRSRTRRRRPRPRPPPSVPRPRRSGSSSAAACPRRRPGPPPAGPAR